MRHSFGYMKLFLKFTALLASLHCFAAIREVSTMEEAATYLKSLNKEDLAIFDIDMVLIQPDDPTFQMATMQSHLSTAQKIIAQVPQEKLAIFFTLMTTSCGACLVDPFCLQVLSTLRKNQVPTMALTGNFTGKFKEIENLEERLLDSLSKLGIDFSLNPPYKELITFQESTSRGNYPTYREGVLFVNGMFHSKGEALTRFLTKINYMPKKIIFIDDLEKHLKTVEASLHIYNSSIEYLGLLFTGANHYPSIEVGKEEFEEKWQACALLAQEIE